MKHAHRPTPSNATHKPHNSWLAGFAIVAAAGLLTGCPEHGARPAGGSTSSATGARAPSGRATSAQATSAQVPIPRIGVEQARQLAASGDALLVCAYDSESKCRSVLFEGAITLGELRARESTLSKDKQLFFYCS